MSTSSASRNPDHVNLESARKEAKRWLNALRADESGARERLLAAWPKAPDEPSLRDVQHALARERGFESWSALKTRFAELELARRTDAERAAEFLEQACLNYGMRPESGAWDPSYPDDPSRRQYAARILARHPEVAAFSIHTAVVSGDIAEVERILARRPEAASQKGGLRQWPPLLYLCFSRLPVAAAMNNSFAIARMLLDHGAPPDVGTSDGENRFTALTAVIGEGERTYDEVPPHPHAAKLVDLLLERGADPYDTQSMYNTSLWRDDTSWMDLLFTRTAQKQRWNLYVRDLSMLTYLLGNAVVRNHLRRATWLLEHGAKAEGPHAYSNRPLHDEAQLHGFSEMAALLERFGARPSVFTGREQFQAACMRADREQARQLIHSNPEYLRDGSALIVAASTRRPDVVELLLDLGMNVDIENGEGVRALHSAAWWGAMDVVQLLVRRGADVNARERKYGGTPLSHAIHGRQPRTIDFLAELSNDVFALTNAGKIERLRTVLASEPQLAQEVRDGFTPLFCLQDDEDLAFEIAQLLLACGADPRVRSSAGVSAADQAEKLGLDAVVELLRRRDS